MAAEADDRDAKSVRAALRGGVVALACAALLATVCPTLTEEIAPGRAADLWQVTALESRSRLNVRAKPSTEGRILARLTERAVVHKLGCINVGTTTWCKVETQAGAKASGWIDVRYLAEASFTGSIPNARAAAGRYDAVGRIDCMFEGNDTLRTCPFGVVRTGYRQAKVDITFPGGFKLKLTFNDHRVTASLGRATSHREGSATIVTVSGTEHFVIPDSVIEGDPTRRPR